MEYLELIKSILVFAENNEDKSIVEGSYPKKFYNTLEQLINHGYIGGKIYPTKDGRLFDIKYLTLEGEELLSNLNKSASEKYADRIKKYVKENGVPTNLTNLTKMFANIFIP